MADEAATGATVGEGEDPAKALSAHRKFPTLLPAFLADLKHPSEVSAHRRGHRLPHTVDSARPGGVLSVPAPYAAAFVDSGSKTPILRTVVQAHSIHRIADILRLTTLREPIVSPTVRI